MVDTLNHNIPLFQNDATLTSSVLFTDPITKLSLYSDKCFDLDTLLFVMLCKFFNSLSQSYNIMLKRMCFNYHVIMLFNVVSIPCEDQHEYDYIDLISYLSS